MNLLAQGAQVPLGELKPPTQAFAPDVSSNLGAVAPLGKVLTTLIGFLTTLAGLMFLVYFLLAALSWITAGGEKGKIETAKSQMINSAIGLIIVIATYAIVGIVGGVLGLDILNPGKIILNIAPKP
jgi:uncharacterized membrane protein YphA (DoxX/SURF4 family)